MNMQILKATEGTRHYIDLAGEIDAYTAPKLKEELMPLAEQKRQTIVVDLSKVTYLDSTGLGIFVGALKKSHQNESEVILKNLTERVERLFTITGLNEIFTIQRDNVLKKGEEK